MVTNAPAYTYEVLRYEARVELLDAVGALARYTRTELVRFLKSTSTIYDYGWGNGIAFAEHETSRGKFAEKKLIGARLRSAVQLPDLQRTGDVLPFSFERMVQRGFESPAEWWLEAELYHPTQHVSLVVLLPATRAVRDARVVTLENPEGTPLKPALVSDGRQCIAYDEDNPRVGQRFTVLWDW